MLILSELQPKINVFIVITKNSSFDRNVDIKRDMGKKRFFVMVITKKVLLLPKKSFFQSDSKKGLFFKMLILSDLQPKINFFIVITKNSSFGRNVDIKRDILSYLLHL